MITREDIDNIVTRYFLSDIIDYIPMKAKIKRKTIDGIIQKKLPERERKRLSLNECLNFEENNRVIEMFINVLGKWFSHCDLSTFYENIKQLKIIEKDKTLIEKLTEILSIKSVGSYSTSNNSIRIYPNTHFSEIDMDSTKAHELLHMATTRKVRNVTVCGFERYSNGIAFATGLNEGYTEWLNRMYFTRRDGGSYQALQSIATMIEQIVGREQMQQFFFSNDLDGLIGALEKYSTREDTLKLIQKMDYIYKCSGKPGGKFIKKRLCRAARVDAANICVRKIKEMFESGQITERYYKDQLFNLELFTHDMQLVFCRSHGETKVKSVAISDRICFEPKVEISPERYWKLSDQYYESKKDSLAYTYEPWHDKDGLGIENIIREENIQTIVQFEQQKGRSPDEVKSEINRMLSEKPSQIPTKTTILKQW